MPKWTKKAAIARMESNQDLQQAYKKYPLAKILIESAAKLKRYPNYHRISCYYVYRDWLNAATTPHDSKEYWDCASVIDDLLPPDACDLELEGVPCICASNPELPDLPPCPGRDRNYPTDWKPTIKSMGTLMSEDNFPEEDKKLALMKEILEELARKSHKTKKEEV